MMRRNIFLLWLVVAASGFAVTAEAAEDNDREAVTDLAKPGKTTAHRPLITRGHKKLLAVPVALSYGPAPENQVMTPDSLKLSFKTSSQQAENLEVTVQKPVKKLEAAKAEAQYQVIFVIPSPNGEPVPLDKDPNLLLSAIVREIKEVKVPSERIESEVRYSKSVKKPEIDIYCSHC